MMVVKVIDPMAVGGDPDHAPASEKGAPGADKNTITVKVYTTEAQKHLSELAKGMESMKAYGGQPSKLVMVHEDGGQEAPAPVALKAFKMGPKGPQIVSAPQAPGPMGGYLWGADMSALEKKISGGGLHPVFEMDKDIAKQAYLIHMSVPPHEIHASITKHEVEDAIGHQALEHLAQKVADEFTADLTEKIVGYIMATFSNPV